MASGERVVPHFREELEQTKARLLEMGGLAEEEVRLSIKGLVERDSTLLEHVMRGDGPLNSLHIEIDNRCFTLLALHQPMAADLRTIVAAVAHREFKELTPKVLASKVGKGGVFVDVKCAFDAKALAGEGLSVWRL